MKKIVCILLSLIICIFCCSCSNKKNLSETSYPLRQINIVYDTYGNILQQIYYNEKTDEYILTEYNYIFKDNSWVCINQTSNIIFYDKFNRNIENLTNKLVTVHYQKDLKNHPLVLMENSYIKVSIIEYLETDDWYDFAYKIKIENFSNQLLTVSMENFTIMGIYCDPVFSIEHVESNSSTDFILGWSTSTLKRYQIPCINNIEFDLKIYNTENWQCPAFLGEHILIKT